MKYHGENAVYSFFYYMWNAWSKEECKIVFGGMCRHFWEKWNAQAEKSIYGAAERFYSELSEITKNYWWSVPYRFMTARLLEKSRMILKFWYAKNAVQGKWRYRPG